MQRFRALTLQWLVTSIFQMSTLPRLNSSVRSQEYAKLRESYDAAFRHLIAEMRRHPMPARHNGDRKARGEANEGIQAATLAVGHQRDLLADFLLRTHEDCVPCSRVQHAAYFLWLNSGCPSGTSASDWFSAERQLSEAEK